eukprot:Nitzschia sp. Nitz4//scaffold201_size42423//3863//4867//NITZ4_007366-RA/size42423-snap-gene-0.36-mRNA-1//1//CDS//3329541308//5002//frame0
MDAAAINIVVSSWENVKKMERYSERFGTSMFTRVNQLSPDLGAKFSSLSSGETPRHMLLFVGMVDMMVQLLGPDMAVFAQRVMDLGERHSKYGIRSLDFPIFWKALSFALTEMLGREVFRGQVEAAWLRLWHCVSLAMIQGSRRVTDRSKAPVPAPVSPVPQSQPANGRGVGRAKSFVSKLKVFHHKHDATEDKSPTRNSYAAFLRASKQSSPTSSATDLPSRPLSAKSLKSSFDSSGHLAGRSRTSLETSHFSTSYLSKQSSPSLHGPSGRVRPTSGSKNASWDPIDLALAAAKARTPHQKPS